MRFVFIIHVLLFVFLSELGAQDSTSINGKGVPLTEQVQSTGVGINEDEAYKAAVQDAIRQVVGTLVTSDTVVNNDHIITDQILTLSIGFVDQVISQDKGKLPDGSWQVKLNCIVRKGQVWDRLEDNKIPTKFDGTSIFADSISQASFNKDAHAVFAQTVRNFFRDYPTIYEFDTEKPKIITARDDVTRIEIHYTIKANKNLYYSKILPPLVEALSKCSKEIFTYPATDGYNRSLDNKYNENRDGLNPIVIFTGSEYNLYLVQSDILTGCDLSYAYTWYKGGFLPASQFFVLFYGNNSDTPILVQTNNQSSFKYTGDGYPRGYITDPWKIVNSQYLKNEVLNIPTSLLPSIVKMKMCVGIPVISILRGAKDSWSNSLMDPESHEVFTNDGWYISATNAQLTDLKIQKGLTGIDVSKQNEIYYVPLK